MNPNFVAQLSESISSKRFNSFGSDTRTALQNYVWNVMLSEALYPSLHYLEVAVRNNVYAAIAKFTKQADWLTHSPNVILKDSERKLVQMAEVQLVRHRKPVTQDRLIAELGWGFWSSLFDRRYERILWPHLLRSEYKLFEYAPNTLRTRKVFGNRLNQIRLLRNRIFHHEPILRGDVNRRVGVDEQYQEVIQTLQWISPATMHLLAKMDRFSTVFMNKNKLVSEVIATL